MDIIRFVFWFLYVRNWHTGEQELSHARLALFSAMTFLIFLAVAIAVVMQAPVEYVAP